MFPASGRYFRALFKQKKVRSIKFSRWRHYVFVELFYTEKKRMVRHKVCSTIKIHHYIRLVCESRAKIPSSDPKTSLTTRRLLFFEAIETIVWKLQIVLAFRIVSKFFESGTIIWKPGLKLSKVTKLRTMAFEDPEDRMVSVCFISSVNGCHKSDGKSLQ